MNAIKEKAISLIQDLPDDCTFEDIQYHLYVCEKNKKGLEDIDAGKAVSQEKARNKMRLG